MKPIFLLLISISLTGTLLYLIYLATSLFWKKSFPAKYNKLALLIISIFFVLPIGKLFYVLAGSIAPLQKNPSDFSLPSSIFTSFDIESTIDSSTQENFAPLFSLSKNHVIFILALIWIFGISISLFYKLYHSLLFKKKLYKIIIPVKSSSCLAEYQNIAKILGIKKEPRLYQTSALHSPIITGVLFPIIILPSQELENVTHTFILKHELYHYKNKDLWIKFFCSILCILHWFNPFVWHLTKTLDNWLEKACDEKVALPLAPKEKILYASAILEASYLPVFPSSRGFSSSFNENKNKTKERVTYMLKSKKHTKKIIASSVLCLALLCATGTIIAFSTYSPQESTAPTSDSTNSSVDTIQGVTQDEKIKDETEKEYEQAVQDMQNASSSAYPLSNPCPEVRYTSRGFVGPKEDDLNSDHLHSGIDLNAPIGTSIVAAGAGTAITSGTHESYGNYIIIDHDNGMQTLYAHCDTLLVETGQIVATAQKIATVGQSGLTDSSCLHFEVLINNTPTDPTLYFALPWTQ